MDADPACTSRPTRIVVIGGGFSGAMTAVHIARLSKYALDLTVVDRQDPVGRGVAYRHQRTEYLLNVPARNMSAFPDRPDHFLGWLRTRPEFDSIPELELRERFIPRQIYGDYLCSIVQHHCDTSRGSTPAVSRFVCDEAVDIEPQAAGCLVRLGDGSTLEADRVVLATGNEAPAPLPGAHALADHRCWVGNPWQDWAHRLPHNQASIVILGTGLTAIDAILTLRTMGWAGPIHAVSRHGRLPHAHFPGFEYPDFPPADVDLATLGLDRLLELVWKHCAILQERNANPGIIVDKLRPHTQRIWARFSADERRRFTTEHVARWNVFRHRMAPQIHAQITAAQLDGQLQVHSADVEKLAAADGRILVHLGSGEVLAGELVINATGPAATLTATGSVLLRNLLRRGLVAPDAANMGLRIDPDHTVFTGDGNRSPWLLALGPLLKGTYWESTAVPELRQQALRVAETALECAPATAAWSSWTPELMEDLRLDRGVTAAR